jgi:hypothetical protein
MPEPFEAAFDAIPGAATYPRSSRYHDSEIGVYRMPDGTEVRYVKHRILPPLPKPAATHVVSEGERPDHLGQRYLNDPTQWWRIADLNPLLDPRELTARPGDVIAVTAE